MPKTKQVEPDKLFNNFTEIKPFSYSYQCECGREMTLDTTERPKKLLRCWQCREKRGEIVKPKKYYGGSL